MRSLLLLLSFTALPLQALDPAALYQSFREETWSGEIDQGIAFFIPTARSVLLDAPLIAAQFSEAPVTREALSDWYIERMPFLEQTQIIEGEKLALQMGVKFRNQNWIFTLRPPGYGRAVILPVRVDAKGHGSKKPTAAKNGLLSLRMAFYEYFYEKIEREILNEMRFHLPNAFPEETTVGSFGAMDWGFDVYDARTGSWIPAGSLTRQLHRRSENGGIKKDSPHFHSLAVESALGFFGISPRLGGYLNVQFSAENAVVDFGHHHLTETGPFHDWAIPIRMAAAHHDFYYLYGSDPVLFLAHYWAEGFRSGRLESMQIQGEVDGFLDSLRQYLVDHREQIRKLPFYTAPNPPNEAPWAHSESSNASPPRHQSGLVSHSCPVAINQHGQMAPIHTK